jgi:hypothetical protein
VLFNTTTHTTRVLRPASAKRARTGAGMRHRQSSRPSLLMEEGISEPLLAVDEEECAGGT